MQSRPIFQPDFSGRPATLPPVPSESDARMDIDAILAGFELQRIRRYYQQVHWTDESRAATRADRLEPGLKLENVAAHSWHVADAAILIAVHFPVLRLERVAPLSILHDKLEIFTGDYDPVGDDGRGTNSHAFSDAANQEKTNAEIAALSAYLKTLPPVSRDLQEELLIDIIHGTSDEAKFVKSIDKLQALAFVHVKKDGIISDDHIAFSLRYSRKAIAYYPPLLAHYGELRGRFLRRIADRREMDQSTLEARLLSRFRSYLYEL